MILYFLRIIHYFKKGGIGLEYRITPTVIIDEKEEIESRIARMMNIETVDFDSMSQFIRDEKSTIFYFDEKLGSRRPDDGKKIKYIWLDSGYRLANKDTLFIAMINYDGIYKGHYIGTAKYLARQVASKNFSLSKIIYGNINERFLPKYEQKAAKRNTVFLKEQDPQTADRLINGDNTNARNDLKLLPQKNESLHRINTDDFELECKDTYKREIYSVTKEIYDQLLLPNLRTIEGLDRYLKDIGSIMNRYVKEQRQEYYVINKIKSIIINTGLMDNFGNDILLLYKYIIAHNNYRPYSVIRSKKDFLTENFTKEDCSREIKPVQFMADGERGFSPLMNDFDIDYNTLTHIIEENKARFPENVYNMPSNNIASKIKDALKRGLKMQQRDGSYAKPIYSGKRDSISWLIPLHINSELSDEPELVLVLRKTGEFYEIKTALPYDDIIKDKITSLSLYNRFW